MPDAWVRIFFSGKDCILKAHGKELGIDKAPSLSEKKDSLASLSFQGVRLQAFSRFGRSSAAMSYHKPWANYFHGRKVGIGASFSDARTPQSTIRGLLGLLCWHHTRKVHAHWQPFCLEDAVQRPGSPG